MQNSFWFRAKLKVKHIKKKKAKRKQTTVNHVGEIVDSPAVLVMVVVL